MRSPIEVADQHQTASFPSLAASTLRRTSVARNVSSETVSLRRQCLFGDSRLFGGDAGSGTNSRRRLGAADGPPLRGDDSNLFLRPEPREPRGLHLLDQRVGRQTASVRSFGNPPRVIAEVRETHSRKLDGNAESARWVRAHPPQGDGALATSKNHDRRSARHAGRWFVQRQKRGANSRSMGASQGAIHREVGRRDARSRWRARRSH
jgi:hypothetical protein